jgi:7-cyano-7-deazaguanine synthase
MMKAVCLLSGGMDSSTLAYVAKSKGYDILALHLNYGQRTERKELASAKKIAGLLEAEAFIEIDLDYFTKFGASSLTDKGIAVEVFDPARAHMPNTYVPFRNANLLSIATSFAEARGADAIFIGVQSRD